MAASNLTNAGKVETLLGDLRKLPLLPAAAQQAMALANDDAANLNEFSRLVERDVTLATSLLKLANSPMFSWGRTVESLGQAVVRLGLRECQNLMVAVSMGNLFEKTDPKAKGYCAVLWKHCFLTACLCRRLNQGLHFDYQGEEFTAGLLHDLGRIVIAVTMPEQFLQVDPLDFVEDAGILQRERAQINTDHCELGNLYAQQNRLPFSAIAAIRFHHQPAESKDHRGILALVAIADDMANHFQRGEKPEAYDATASPGFPLIGHAWPAEKAAEFKRIVPKLLEETARAAAEPTGNGPAAIKPERPRAAPEPRAAAESSFWGNVRSWLGK
jgi:HD-like signal output (HDOD) protein